MAETWLYYNFPAVKTDITKSTHYLSFRIFSSNSSQAFYTSAIQIAHSHLNISVVFGQLSLLSKYVNKQSLYRFLNCKAKRTCDQSNLGEKINDKSWWNRARGINRIFLAEGDLFYIQTVEHNIQNIVTITFEQLHWTIFQWKYFCVLVWILVII